METLHELSAFFRQFWGLWLMILFLGVIAWAYRPKNKDRFDDDAMIPLRDEDENEERTNGGNP
jgi:cytochrome c oxidase cbb3-type subunit 4